MGGTRVEVTGNTTVVLYGADLVDAMIAEGQADVDSSVAEASAHRALAAGEADRAEAAADLAVTNVPMFATKAAANTALAGVAAGAFIEVEVDESLSNKRTRYQKQSGAYVYILDLPSVPPGGAVAFTRAGALFGGVGAKATTGVLNWNDATNTRSGQGETLLLGSASNGPGGVDYFHPWNFEYASDDGSGNVTQIAIPYSQNAAGSDFYFRGRWSGTWSGWRRMLTLDGSGFLGIGTTSPSMSLHISRVDQSVARVRIQNTGTGGQAFDIVAGIHSSSQAGLSLFNATTTATLAAFDPGTNVSGATLGNAANAALKVNKDATSSRSINAAGTVNASGADYAEYMVKADGCGAIAKGDVCGVDADGHLTKSWAAAVSFVVKSTDPAYVGGDRWDESAGERPAQEDNETDTDFFARLGDWSDALEAARQSVDRIAFCGQTPVNFDDDCEVGDYLIAAANGGGIKLVAVGPGEINFDQYRRRVGKVWAIREGRPWIDVQHG